MAFTFDYSTKARLLISEKERVLLKQTYDEAVILEASFVIDVTVLSPEEMRELNRDTRSIDKATDVLSYPVFTSIYQIPLQHIPEVALGSIVICPDYANEQGTPLIELIHHGVLHLFGYDHEERQEEWDANEKGILEKAHQLGLPLKGLANLYL